MQAFVMGVADYFDVPPRVEAAMRDGADRRAEAAFSASLRRVPVRGVLSVTAQGEGGQGVMILDYADRLRAADDTIAGGNAGAARAGENANAAWSQYLRGTTTIETEEGGVRVREEVDRDFGRYWAREFPQDYREVPLNELVVR
jgi:hypothetical protein